jgi:8-oxo-dGTP diphosphatase
MQWDETFSVPVTRQAAGVVLHNAAGEALLVRERGTPGQAAKAGLWHLPMGTVEDGELPGEAAVREAWEETGLRVSLGPLLGTWLGRFPDGVLVQRYVWRAQADPAAGLPTPAFAHEISEARYFGRCEVQALYERRELRMHHTLLALEAAWLHAPPAAVVVRPYDPAWADCYAALHAGLWPLLGDVAHALEHVGSTSVPGLSAKPVLDVDVVVPDDRASREVRRRLEGLGYRHRGDLGVPGREACHAPPGSDPLHLYVCLAGGEALHNHLTVRDALRADPEAARQYGELKIRLAQQYPGDPDSYGAAKTDFLTALLARQGTDAATLERIRAINLG